MRQSVEGEESPCRISARTATVSPLRTTCGGYRPDTERATTERRSIATGGANFAKVFRAHAAVPQGSCENLINALKLLANQQRDGDSPIQNIFTGLREKKKERVTNGLRSFIAQAIIVPWCGPPAQILAPFRVKNAKIGEDHSEVLREGADDLTLRAEEVDTLKACINVGHIGEILGPPLVDADWHAFCQAIREGIEGSEWEELYHHYREMSMAAGSKKPNESE